MHLENLPYLGTSTDLYKNEVVIYFKERLPLGSLILDVGAGNGNYRWYFGCGYYMDAIETWQPAIDFITPFYNNVFNINIKDFSYNYNYDLIIFGDIIEHLTVEEAQRVLKIAQEHSRCILVAVPFWFWQDEIHGNPMERHLQPELSPTNFKERYPDFLPLISDYKSYGYYIWERK